MKGISKYFYTAFFTTLIKNHIKEHKSCYEEGRKMGKRLIDDFCAKNYIYTKFREEDAEKMMRLLLKEYVTNESVEIVVLNRSKICIFLPEILEMYNSENSREFLKGFLIEIITVISLKIYEIEIKTLHEMK
ncbi:hypothetical protein NUSPORA_03023 [Nucleospora cyclopteri]